MAIVLPLVGLTDYDAAHALQQALLVRRIAGEIPDVLLMLEHRPAITVGRAQQALGNVLNAGDIPVYPVKRGGDVTVHGPGQLVAYPIIALEGSKRDLHNHLNNLEDAGIRLCQQLGLTGLRDERNTGVWLNSASGPPQKVMSVGIACKRWVTWHGLALNVDIDIDLFSRINPCGFQASVMTRLCEHLSPCPSVADLVEPLAEQLLISLGLTRSSPDEHRDLQRWTAALGADLAVRDGHVATEGS